MDSQLDSVLATARNKGWTVVLRGPRPGGSDVIVEVNQGKEVRTQTLDAGWLAEQPEPEDVFAQTIQGLIGDPDPRLMLWRGEKLDG